LFLHNNIPASVMGDMLYASASAGALTVTPNGSFIGKLVWKTGGSAGIVAVSTGSGGTPHSYLYDDETQFHYTVGSILHSAINNDEPGIHASMDDLVGHVTLYFGGNTPPVNYLECAGALISKTTYADLYTGKTFSIGGRFGESGGNFYLPDFRGRGPRGYDHGIGRDPDRLSRYADNGGVTGDTPGSMQNDQYKSHAHGPSPGYTNFLTFSGPQVYGDIDGNDLGTFSATAAAGGNESRGKNFSTMWVIRYQ
jgi:microcystin-dependent protein